MEEEDYKEDQPDQPDQPDNKDQSDIPDNPDNQGLRREWYKAGMWSFLLLFLLAAGLLFYYQFYQGDGRWRFTLVHPANRINMISISQAELDSMLIRLDSTAARQTPDSLSVPAEPEYPAAQVEVPSLGTVYTVQIGIFENYDLRRYKGTYNAMHQEKEGSSTKLTLGEFATHADATAFARDVKKMGIKDAWVVKLQDGKRVPISEAAPKKPGKKRR